MTATSLPTEIWIIVAQTGILVQNDLHSMTLVSRDFNQIFTPILYSFLQLFIEPARIPPVFSSTAKFDLEGSPWQRLLELLDSSEIHRDFVRSILLQKSPSSFLSKPNHIKTDLLHPVVGSIMELLARLTELQSLSIFQLPLQDEWIYRIAQRPLKSLTVKRCNISTESIVNGSLAVKNLQVDYLLPPLIYCGHVESLEFDGTLLQLHQALPSGPSFLQLKIFKLDIINLQCLEFFRYTPNLLEISIEDYGFDLKNGFDYADSSRPSDWTSFLPKLQSFDGPLSLVPLFVSGRDIRSIACKMIWRGITADELSQLGPSFGSKVPICKLFWQGHHSRQVLEYIAKHNSGVHVLRLFEHYSITNEEFPLFLEGFKKLNQLRYLQFPRLVLQLNRAHFEWERAQCELIRNSGCEQLELVKLSWDTEWIWCCDEMVWKPNGAGAVTLMACE